MNARTVYKLGPSWVVLAHVAAVRWGPSTEPAPASDGHGPWVRVLLVGGGEVETYLSSAAEAQRVCDDIAERLP